MAVGDELIESVCPPQGGMLVPGVEISSTASQTVTKKPAVLPSQSWLFTFSRAWLGLSPLWRRDLMSTRDTIMNSAAGMPLPDTSAMTMAMWSSSTRKKS